MTEELQIPEKVRKVYEWCSQLTAESRKELKSSYVWPDEIKQLASRLMLTKGALIALQGYSGTGKSSALAMIGQLINKNKIQYASFKLVNRDLVKSFADGHQDDYYGSYIEQLKEAYAIRQKLASWRGKRLPSDPDDFESLEEFEAFFKKGHLREIRKEAVLDYLSKSRVIMIDLQDYSITDRRTMTGDLNVIQEVWNYLTNNDWEGNLVVSVQKELVEGEHGATHYLLRKMDIVELKPFKPGRLVEAYTQAFKEVYPFQEQALMRVARLSRGIWRRYLRYIRLCLDAWIAKGMKGEIDTAFTSEAVSNMEVGKDIEDELTSMFPKSDEMRRKALKTIHYLISLKKGILQKALAKGLNLSETETSRLFDKMDARGLTYRQQTPEGKMVFSNI